jgi:hypothetical protein
MFAFNFKPPQDPHAPIIKFKEEVKEKPEKPKVKKVAKPEPIQEIKEEVKPKVKKVVKQEPIQEVEEEVKPKVKKVVKPEPIQEVKEIEILEEKPKSKKLVKGSEEAKVWAAKMREIRKIKLDEKKKLIQEEDKTPEFM